MHERRWIRDPKMGLKEGDKVKDVFLVTKKDLRQTRTGSLYLDGEIMDRTGAMPMRMWDATQDIADSFNAQDFVQITGRIESYKDKLQLIVNKVAPVDDSTVDMEDFLPASPHNVDEMEQNLRKILRTVEDKHLLALLGEFFNDEEFMAKFRQCPAAMSMHHAYLGGLLEHTLSVAKLAVRVASEFPSLRKDLLLAGAFLHDIGKVHELTWDRGFMYTDQGQLVGHLVLGVSMIDAKASQIEDFPDELLDMLKHLVLSHHGQHEFGSPKLPSTIESIALHYLDNLDAKIHAFNKAIENDRNAGSKWTEYNRMFERRLFKG